MRKPIISAVVGLSLCVAGAALAEDAGWTTNASAHQNEVGKVFTWSCPPNGAAGGTVYGTDLYTTDSPVCTAAVHAGKISFEKGGSVTFQIRAGANSYAGTTRAGIASRSWASYGSSFTFDIDKDVNESNTISWSQSASNHASDTGKSFTFTCAANGALGAAIYGSDTYTTDSAICVAAVHAGKIQPAGGKVTIQISGGLPSYTSTTRNGVKSNAWAAYGSSYTFQ